jgi:hypothetical protein
MKWCWVVKGDGSNAKQRYSTKNKRKTIKYMQKQAKKKKINIVCLRKIVYLIQTSFLFTMQSNGNHIKP